VLDIQILPLLNSLLPGIKMLASSLPIQRAGFPLNLQFTEVCELADLESTLCHLFFWICQFVLANFRKSHLKTGGEAHPKIRTKWVQKFEVSVPSGGWNGGVEVLEPFKENQKASWGVSPESVFVIDRKQHLLHTAMRWQAYMAETRMVPSSVIAFHAGVSPGRVRQILKLNRLDQDLKAHILAMDPATANKKYAESRLRTLRK
jgi:hypothetical protein